MVYYSLDNLEELAQGNDQFVRTLIQTFLKQIPESIAHMEKYLGSSDLYSLGKEAHKLKPSLDLFSIEQGREVIRDLEKIEQSGDQNRANQLFSSLKEILLGAKQGLEEELL